ncbi:SWF/SNF helicase family protein, partial [Schumannella luteola]
LDREKLEAFDEVDLANGHLRALAEQTVGDGWWRLLWMPPTMPYIEPGPVFGPLSDGRVTKQVIFSAWSGVPTAVAALLSYEADRQIAADRSVLRANTPDARKAVRSRLNYPLPEGRPAAMSTLALFWPHPALAELGDPLEAARRVGGRISDDDLVADVASRLSAEFDADQLWEASFGTPGGVPDDIRATSPEQLAAGGDDEEGPAGLIAHIRLALDTPTNDPRTHPELARLAAHAPGNVAWRALRSVAGPEASEQGMWRAAFELAGGIRTLFNRKESIALLVALYGDDRQVPFWLSVLAYCADGNLQAVLDEYLFQLMSENGGAELGDAELLDLARRAVDALSLRPARYEARDVTPERAEIPLVARFALRYGGKTTTDADERAGVRQGEVRAAFNSPFAPFVLASTSVGQEGIDFHWWSHSVVHWNLPSNPVDFEQREGRVNRYAGHAVRKNVATAHWQDVVGSSDPRAWRAAFDAAGASDSSTLGEFSPWWIYPGPARIHRLLATYPLSRDADKYERLRSALTLYRLTLGQPRQEDMIDMLARRDVADDALPTIDLRPPSARRRSVG